MAAALAVIAAAAAVALTQPGHSHLAHAVAYGGTTFLALIAAVSAERTARRLPGKPRRLWSLLALGCVAWAVSGSVAAWYSLVLGQELSFPHPAHGGSVVFSLLAIMALAHAGPAAQAVTSVRRLLDGAIIALALGSISWLTVVEPVIGSPAGALQRGVAATSLISDVVIIVLVLWLVPLTDNRARSIVLTLAAGLAFISLGNTGLAWLSRAGEPVGVHIAAVGSLAGFLFIILAARWTRAVAGEVPEPGRESAWVHLLPRLPLIALIAIGVAQHLSNGRVDDDFVWIVIPLAVLTMGRQAATHAENARLTTRLEDRVAALRVEEARMRLIIDSAHDPYVEIDADGSVTAWNRQAEATFGWRADEVLGRALHDVIIPPADRAAHVRGLRRVQQTNTSRMVGRPVEVTAMRRDGGKVPVELTVWQSSGKRGSRYHAFIRDISERRRAAEALEQSEERWRSLVRHSSDYTVLLTEDGTLDFELPTVRPLFGYHDEENIGRNFIELVHPDDQAAALSAFEILRTTPGHQDQLELRVQRGDGTWMWVDVVGTNLLDDATVAGIVINLRDVSDRRRMEEELRHQAMHDPLTGLPNRNQLMASLRERCIRHQHGATALLLMDLNGFKDVNDGLGHDIGDRLLIEVARRLAERTRSADTVARLGGDEFAVVLSDVPAPSHAQTAAEALVALVEHPIDLDGIVVQVGASIGIAHSATGDDPTSLRQRADVAMYRAKREGGGWAMYGSDDDEDHRASVTVAAELREAIGENQLVVHYQPQVELATDRVVAVEALVRWAHPGRGLVAPNDFIPLSERTGLIRPLTDWVLCEALAQCARWQAEGLDLSLAVNLSPRLLNHTGIVESITGALEQAEFPPELLTIEITESAFPENTRALIGAMQHLSRMGIRLSIDDFGTGYSSMAYLKELPVDEVKVDKSFVANVVDDETDRSIVGSIIELARELGLRTVAEGVETQESLDALVELGCEYAQGFHIARPSASAELTGWLAERDATRVATR